MKKQYFSLILLISFALISNMVISQNITLSYSGGAIANGGSITVHDLATTPVISANVYITNTTTDTLQLKCRKFVIDTVTGTTNSFCFGLCFGSTTYVSPAPVAFAGGVTDMSSFVGDYSPNGISGTTTIRYLIFNVNNLNDTASFIINYYAEPTSVNEYAANLISVNAYPNPANSYVSINYDIFKDVSNAKLIIRNILGKTMKEIPLNSISGRLNVNTEDLDEGIYFYSVAINNDIQNSKKLIIRH
ncbi:MAG: T9SS type A sorting domain-containing protein [Bacteroidota bacterium]